MIAVLNMGWVRPELSQLLMELQGQKKYNLFICYPAKKPITNNRNQIVKRFLETDYDYLLMIDGDNVPPLDILNLADFQKDIIGALCFGWMKKMIIPFCLNKNDSGSYDTRVITDGEGLVECDAIGSGVMMIKREVLEKMPFPFRNEYDSDGVKGLGLDINFCKRAKKMGFKVFCHTDYRVSHWTDLDLRVIYENYTKVREAAKTYYNELKKLQGGEAKEKI